MRSISNNEEEKRKDFEKLLKEIVEKELYSFFLNYIDDYNFENASYDLINNKDIYIQNIATKILKKEYIIEDIEGNYRYYFNKFIDEKDLYYISKITDNLYIKTYKKIINEYKLKDKAKIQIIEQKIYNKIKTDIEYCMQQKEMDLIIKSIKTIDYKKAIVKDLNIKENEIKIFDNVYIKTRNKVIQEFKDTNIIQQNKVHIPSGMKAYLITKGINKLFKVKI